MGFGIGILSFFVLAIIVGVTYDNSENSKSEKEFNQLETNRPVTIEENNSFETKNEKLSEEEIQKIVAGFEFYNKSVKILLDACAAVETEEDFAALGLLVAEQGEKFLDVTTTYGSYRDTLLSEGYGDHPKLGPLLDQSAILVSGMSACMEVLAWEFSG